MIWQAAAGRVVVVDLGLGHPAYKVQGAAVDLYVLERALGATDARGAALSATVVATYMDHRGKASIPVKVALEKVRARGSAYSAPHWRVSAASDTLTGKRD